MTDGNEIDKENDKDMDRARATGEALDWEKVDQRYDENAGLMLFDKRLDRMKNPRNGKVMDRLVLESVDWVNMVALDADGAVVMIRQYRFGVGYTTLETPGGMVDAGESSRDAAERELFEETGYRARRWTYLGAVEPNPAIFDNLCHHWLAEDATLEAEQDLGDGEMIHIELMDQEAVRRAVSSGEIRHALCLSALARVFPLWPLPFTYGRSE